MSAPVVAVARLSKDYVSPTQPVIPRDPGIGAEGELPEGSNLLNEIYELEDVSVIRNWEWQDWFSKSSVTYNNVPKEYEDLKGTTVKPKDDYRLITNGKEIYGGKWAGFENKSEGKKVRYRSGDHYRCENVIVEPESNDRVSGDKYNPDSLNLDFNPDLQYDFTDDWDIGYPTPNGKTLLSLQNGRSSKDDSKDENTFKLRIHSTFNFETPYLVRKNKAANNPEDALYVRIESEPIVSLPFIKNQSAKHIVFSTVRQIILNINQSNMDSLYRPLMFYYSGPEQINSNNLDEKNGKHIRDSQPVILNLNADARVVLFAPNSPVVIKGNGHKMQGLVIAKEFVRLTTASDYREEGGRYFDKNDSMKEYFYLPEEGTFIDQNGNVQTKSLSTYDVRNPDYIEQLKHDEERTDYADKLKGKEYFTSLKSDEAYADCIEMPENTGNIGDLNAEIIYKANEAFNLSADSYYDSFNIAELKRNVYTYLDNYMDDTKKNSSDMFFTKYRSSWID